MNTRLFNRIDLLIVPVMIVLITAFLFYRRKKQPEPLQKYFIKGFFLRVLGTLALTGLTELYYGFGDTYSYYYNTQLLTKLLLKDPAGWFQVMFTRPELKTEAVNSFVYTIASHDDYASFLYQNNENATVSKVGSIINLICFDSSLGIALLFGLLSFLGCWYIFKAFNHHYPGYEKQFAWFCLYLPSLWFWGSGILKDPLCIYALGILVYNFFVNRSGLLKRMLLICFGAFLLLNIKSYIFYTFCAAAAGAWLLVKFRNFNFIGKLATGAVIVSLLAFSYSSIIEAVSGWFDSILKESATYIYNYTALGREGDATQLPVLDPTPGGLAKLGLNGITTVFLRPFPWELSKFIYIFLILENLLIYYLIFKRIKTGPLELSNKHRMLTNFSFIFFIFLGLVIGVTTFNFGTIARYRVPALPFLFAGIFSLKLANRKRKTDKALEKGSIKVLS